MFKINLSSNRIFSNSKEAINLSSNRKFGEYKEGKVIYLPYEVLYLLENKKAEIFFKDKKLSKEQVFSKLKKLKDFEINYLVFKDLRNKGYIVKTALKFGEEFRVYKKQDKHARWLVYSISELKKINWHEFSSKNRIAHSTNKKLLIALVDKQEDINYYEIS